MLAPYRAVLSTRGAKSFSAAGVIGRLPLSTMGLGFVLLVAARTDSYGLAGAVAAVFTLAEGLAAPVLGRAVDRYGQGRVLLPALTAFTLTVIVLMTSVENDWPHAVTFVMAACGGLLLPPVGACVRARWAYALAGKPNLHTAYALESVLDEVVFMVGPVLVTVLATQVHELAGLSAVLVISGLGVWWLAAQRRTEPPLGGGERPAGRAGDRLDWLWLARLVVVSACLGSLFGATEVVTVAFTDERGHQALAGLLLATWASGSMIAGLVTGLIRWRASVLNRYRWGAVGMAAVMLPLPFVEPMWLLWVALFLAGFAISPTLVAVFSLVEASVPAGRLTEGITWITTGIGLGIAPGAAIAGQIIDAHGASPALLRGRRQRADRGDHRVDDRAASLRSAITRHTDPRDLTRHRPGLNRFRHAARLPGSPDRAGETDRTSQRDVSGGDHAQAQARRIESRRPAGRLLRRRRRRVHRPCRRTTARRPSR